MADAFKIAKGFFPVKELLELPSELTKLLLPLVFVLLVIPFGLVEPPSFYLVVLLLSTAKLSASPLKASIL